MKLKFALASVPLALAFISGCILAKAPTTAPANGDAQSDTRMEQRVADADDATPPKDTENPPRDSARPDSHTPPNDTNTPDTRVALDTNATCSPPGETDDGFICDEMCPYDDCQEEKCADGKDNDGDGGADCEDPECQSLNDSCVDSEEAAYCNDDIDNDGDGAVDCKDEGCADNLDYCGGEIPGQDDCGDGKDNDDDGHRDCEDPDCLSQVCDKIVSGPEKVCCNPKFGGDDISCTAPANCEQ